MDVLMTPLSQKIKNPYKIVRWQDKENTGAIGWIVIHNLVNNISGGGLFIDPNASLDEVVDLAHTMRLKNALQQPMIGGGKGGIKFDPNHPDAKFVLQRFLEDNIEILRKEWCTGGDLNTTTSEISYYIEKTSSLKSPFECLANMLKSSMMQAVNLDQFNYFLNMRENEFFTIEEAITGFGVYHTIKELENIKKNKPKMIVQGFGKVGRSLCFYAAKQANIVGICEKEWFICQAEGINIEKLLAVKDDLDKLKSFNPTLRNQNESSEAFLIRFLQEVNADLFCPCASRYIITDRVMSTLIDHTFSGKNGAIVAGANNIFKNTGLIDFAFEKNVLILPEWLSNAGAAILYMEALKYQHPEKDWINHIKMQVIERIKGFLSEAWIEAQNQGINIYLACCKIAEKLIDNEPVRQRGIVYEKFK